MKQATTTFFILLINVFSYAQSGKIVLQGQVQNQTNTTFSITDFNYREVASAELDAEGNFKMTTKLESDGYYLLNYGRNTAYVYLYPKDDLTLKVDATYFENTLTFEGRGAARNNYLAEKSIAGAKMTENLEDFYVKDEGQYLENLRRVETTHQSSLNTFEVEDFFKKEELKSLKYASLLSIQNYENNYKFYIGEEITASEAFYEPLNGLDLNSELDYKKHHYYYYLVNSIWNKRIDENPTVGGMLKVFRQVRSQPIAVSLVNGFYGKIGTEKERAKDYLDLIKSITTYQPFLEAAEKRYQEVLNKPGLQEGDISPEFNYESVDGDPVSLSDLRGKYVYIDVWATWCAPCIKQVPYLKQLEQSYHNKNVIFVSISVDKEGLKSRWKQMILDKELGGLQLFADNSFESEFMDAYEVNSIPRFILLDPDGKIVSTEAPRPSFEKTRELLDSLVE